MEKRGQQTERASNSGENEDVTVSDEQIIKRTPQLGVRDAAYQLACFICSQIVTKLIQIIHFKNRCLI